MTMDALDCLNDVYYDLGLKGQGQTCFKTFLMRAHLKFFNERCSNGFL